MTEEGIASATLNEKISDILEKIKPHIQADGGDIELVSIDEAVGKVSVRFHGACRGCPMSAQTLKLGVERHIKEHVPEVTEVVAVD